MSRRFSMTMIANVLSASDIGTLELGLEVLKALRGKDWSKQTLHDFLSDNDYTVARSLDGTLVLLRYLGYVEGTDAELHTSTDANFTAGQFLQELFAKLEEDGVLPPMLAHPIAAMEGDAVVIDNELLSTDYAQLRNFLLLSNVMKDEAGDRLRFQVDEAYTYLFKKYAEAQDPVKTLEEFKQELAERERRGREAEEFVVAYERRQRSGHPECGKIRRVSEENVEAGYDIASYASDASAELDKFIEVKSYLGAKRIYWSRNEQQVAAKLGPAYFLYLVDSERIQEPGYEPEVIANPHQALQNADRTCETWRYDLP